MFAQYDRIFKEFKSADKSFPDVTRPILHSLVKTKKGRLLDLGCGYGEDLVYFHKRGLGVFGIDISKEMVMESKKACPYANIIKSSFKKIPFPKNYFNVVYSRYSLQHDEKILPIFKEVHRILKKKGEFVFLVTHPFRQYFEKKTKNYWKQEICKSKILGGKVIVEEPSHNLGEYLNKEILSKFELIDLIEKFDPAAQKVKNAGKYPSILILKFKRKE